MADFPLIEHRLAGVEEDLTLLARNIPAEGYSPNEAAHAVSQLVNSLRQVVETLAELSEAVRAVS